MSNFVPALFSKFGKTSSDLLSQKFDSNKDDFKHQASVKSQSNGVTITSTAVAQDSSVEKIAGKVNVKYEDKKFGDVTVEYATAGKVKISTKLSKLQPGLIVNADVDVAKVPTGKIAAEYVRESYAGSIEYNQAKKATLLSSVIGYDGLSVGAAVNAKCDAMKESCSLSALNLDAGVQYEDGNLIGTLTIESNNNINLSLFHRVNSDLQLASKFVVTSDAGNSLALGAQYKVNPATLVKGRAVIFSDNTYAVAGFLQHRLASPNVTVGVSNQVAFGDSKKGFAPGFGVNLSFGDL